MVPPDGREEEAAGHQHLAISISFATTASAETLNGTSLGVAFVVCPPLSCPKIQITPKIRLFNNKTHHYINQLQKQRREPYVYIYIYM